MAKKVKVLIVDDSALARGILTQVLSQDPEIEVVGTAMDGTFAMRKVRELNPDVITLDVEMRQMGGLEFLEHLMKTSPRPVIMVSSHTTKGAQATMKALELGAADFVTKPSASSPEALVEALSGLAQSIKAIGNTSFRGFHPAPVPPRPAMQSPVLRSGPFRSRVLAIGCSTGGPEALKQVLMNLPENIPPTVVVQHMPETFTKAFADRLNKLCPMRVEEACDHHPLEPGLVLIAPGHSHMRVKRIGGESFVTLDQSPPVGRHRPSVDVLFESVARQIHCAAVGVILTGMGADGARGMLQMKQEGAFNIAQDENSCVVFGMPKEAIAAGGVDVVAPLDRIPEEIIQALSRSDRPASIPRKGISLPGTRG